MKVLVKNEPGLGPAGGVVMTRGTLWEVEIVFYGTGDADGVGDVDVILVKVEVGRG